MKLLQDLQGRWDKNDNALILSWDVSKTIYEDYLHVIDMSPNRTDREEFKDSIMRDGAARYGMKRIQKQRLTNEIEIAEFFVFMSDSMANTPNNTLMNICEQYPEGRLKVAMGHAAMAYSVRRTQIKPFQCVRLIIKADRRIPRGLVGYQYQLGEKQEIIELPMDIPASKFQTPPILVPSDSEVGLIPLKDCYRGNIDISKQFVVF